eukprot:1148188-Pelagomonas_calceolata.AAC.7
MPAAIIILNTHSNAEGACMRPTKIATLAARSPNPLVHGQGSLTGLLFEEREADPRWDFASLQRTASALPEIPCVLMAQAPSPGYCPRNGRRIPGGLLQGSEEGPAHHLALVRGWQSPPLGVVLKRRTEGRNQSKAGAGCASMRAWLAAKRHVARVCVGCGWVGGTPVGSETAILHVVALDVLPDLLLCANDWSTRRGQRCVWGSSVSERAMLRVGATGQQKGNSACGFLGPAVVVNCTSMSSRAKGWP